MDKLNLLFYFVTSKIFIKNTTLMLLLLVSLVLLTFEGLKCYTNHGEAVSIPNFKGQTLRQVESQLRKHNLQIQVMDSVYDPDKLPLTVMEQTPLPTTLTGLKVKENRTIYLTVNSTMPPLRSLPKVWDRDETFAKNQLTNLGFVPYELKRRPDRAVNTVLEMHYNGKMLDRDEIHRLPANSRIGLVIADGGGSEVAVPRVICMTYEEAEMNIVGANLSMLIIEKDGTVTNETTAYIWKQSPMPEPGLMLKVGDEVNVWLTQNEPPGCADADNNAGGDTEQEDDGGFGGF